MNLNLKEIRKAAGFTQSDLAKAIGVNLSTVGNWERLATLPDASQIWDCAVALGCTPNDILGWYESHPREAERDLTDGEREVLACYRESTPQWRGNIAMCARAAAGESKKEESCQTR